MTITTTPRRRVAARRTLLTLTLAALAAGVSGCGAVTAVNSSITGIESRHFDTRADAPKRGDLAFVLPSAVPQDATDVSVTVKTEEPGVAAYAWTSAQDPPGSCTAADGSPSPQPSSPKGFPKDLDVSGAVLCDTLVQVRDGDRTYAWLAPNDGEGSTGTAK